MTDDQGYGDLSCMGTTDFLTPHIDELATGGARFTNWYSNSPVCSPSRASLLTGRYPGNAGVRAILAGHRKATGLTPEAPTIATALRDVGYQTAMVGKWHLGLDEKCRPNQNGFDYFYGYLCQRMAQCYYPPFLYNGTVREYTNNPPMDLGDKLDEGADPYDRASYAKFKGETYSPDAIYDKIEKWVDENHKNPFFLMWTTTIPHSALTAPDEWVDRYVQKFGAEEPVYTGKGYFPTRYPKATYAAMISYLDYQIGELVKQLKAKGLYDNTIIMVTSDNGPTHNSYTSTSWFDCAAPFRSDRGYTKRSLHEGGIRVPFIVSWGDRLRPAVCDYIGYFPDVMPTLAAIAGIPQSEWPKCDGESFLPSIMGRYEEQANHPYLYWEFPKYKGGNGWLCVRMGKWKGLVEDVADGCTKMQLYNIEEDKREEHDVAAAHPDIVADMWQAIHASHTPAEHPLFKLDIRYPDSFRVCE